LIRKPSWLSSPRVARNYPSCGKWDRRLRNSITQRAATRHIEAKATYEALARFDLTYFGDAWGNLLAQAA
jgi:hypothetical protein